VTIESLLDQSGCDWSHKCVQDGCSDTYVMLEASKSMWSGNMVLCLRDHRK